MFLVIILIGWILSLFLILLLFGDSSNSLSSSVIFPLSSSYFRLFFEFPLNEKLGESIVIWGIITLNYLNLPYLLLLRLSRYAGCSWPTIARPDSSFLIMLDCFVKLNESFESMLSLLILCCFCKIRQMNNLACRKRFYIKHY